MNSLVTSILSAVPTWAVYVSVFVLPFLESSVLLGFVFPGETSLILGGVLAGRGQVSLAVVLVLGIVGAISGDTVGYAVGRRYGHAIQASRLGQKLGDHRWVATHSFVQRHGAVAVFLGRFTAVLRAVVPGVAGMAHMPYKHFAAWNIAGGAVWTALIVVGSWTLGSVIGSYLGYAGYALVGVVIAAVGLHLVRARRR
jgi:membrane-associated protein